MPDVFLEHLPLRIVNKKGLLLLLCPDASLKHDDTDGLLGVVVAVRVGASAVAVVHETRGGEPEAYVRWWCNVGTGDWA